MTHPLYLQIERTTKQLSEALEEKKQLTNQNGELNAQHEATKTELQDIMKKLGKLFLILNSQYLVKERPQNLTNL